MKSKVAPTEPMMCSSPPVPGVPSTEAAFCRRRPMILVHILPEPVLLLHQPVDQLVHRRFELRRRVADHPLLELLAHALALDQIARTCQPHRLIEERSPRSRICSTIVSTAPEPLLEGARHLLGVRRHLRLDVLDRARVLVQQRPGAWPPRPGT